MGRDKLYSYLASNYSDYPTREQVMQWLKNQKVWQIHNRPISRISSKHIIVDKPLIIWSVDLTGPLIRDQGFNYIFGIIDINTKLLYTAPLKKKNSLETAKEFSYLNSTATR